MVVFASLLLVTMLLCNDLFKLAYNLQAAYYLGRNFVVN